MRSPEQLAEQLARRWQRSDWREAHLLPNPGAWPLRLDIGAPSSQSFRDAGPALRQHLQAWRAVTERGPGTVQWAPRSYRGSAAPLEVPARWELERPSDAIAAISRFAGREHAGIAADYQALLAVLAQRRASIAKTLAAGRTDVQQQRPRARIGQQVRLAPVAALPLARQLLCKLFRGSHLWGRMWGWVHVGLGTTQPTGAGYGCGRYS